MKFSHKVIHIMTHDLTNFHVSIMTHDALRDARSCPCGIREVMTPISNVTHGVMRHDGNMKICMCINDNMNYILRKFQSDILKTH